MPCGLMTLFGVVWMMLCWSQAASASSSLHDDLHAILRGRLPRLHGEMPAQMGGYERIAPGTDEYHQVRLQLHDIPATRSRTQL